MPWPWAVLVVGSHWQLWWGATWHWAISLDSKKGNGEHRKEQAMELSISKGRVRTERQCLPGFRSQAKKVNATDNGYVKIINSKLHNKIHIPKKAFTPMAWTDNSFKFPFQKSKRNGTIRKYKECTADSGTRQGRCLSGKKGQARRSQGCRGWAYHQRKKMRQRPYKKCRTATIGRYAAGTARAWQQQRMEGLLKNFGLNGFSDIGNNLGYVIAMLPDILVGLFTGKTQSLGLKDNMMPIAAILAGMFVKNPLLKMTLIGMGGANLLNKGRTWSIGKQTGKAMMEMLYHTVIQPKQCNISPIQTNRWIPE